MTTGPQDPAAAGRDRLRAGHADREQAIETLKDAFVHGRLTKEELDTRAGQALVALTCADLAALTADITPGPLTAKPARPPARRRPLARAAAGSGVCLAVAATALWLAALADPGPPGPTPYHSFAPLCLIIAFFAALAALGTFGLGVVAAVEQRRARRQLPPPPGPGGDTAPGNSGRGDAGLDPAPPSRPGDQACAGLRPHKSRRHRYVPARAIVSSVPALQPTRP